jgi:hydroxypyruvate isomerase
MPDFAANLSTMFTDLPVLERFDAAARCGFDAVELAFPYGFPKDEVAKQLRERRLTLIMFNLPAGRREEGEQGIACHPDRTAEFREGVHQAIDYAAAVNSRFLNCLAGIRPNGASDETMRQTFVENLRFAARQAKSIGATILIEPVDTRTLPGAYLHSTVDAIWLLDRVEARNVSLLYDVYHMYAMGEPTASAIARNLPRIGHIQIAGYPGRSEPISGEIDYDHVLDVIDRLGHRGWVGCEYVPNADTEAGLAWMTRHKGLTPRTPCRWGIPVSALPRQDSSADASAPGPEQAVLLTA